MYTFQVSFYPALRNLEPYFTTPPFSFSIISFVFCPLSRTFTFFLIILLLNLLYIYASHIVLSCHWNSSLAIHFIKVMKAEKMKDHGTIIGEFKIFLIPSQIYELNLIITPISQPLPQKRTQKSEK